MKNALLIFTLIISACQAYAQGVAVSGTVQSTSDSTALPGATVILEQSANTTATVTDTDGRFRFERVQPGQYTVRVNYLGFQPFTRTFQVQQSPVNLGSLSIQEESTTIKEVQIVGRVPLGDQKGDTAQYNAGAFKTAPDASAEDLVTKMPGITIQDGKIQAQGEDVKQVFVDGKRFFGEEADAALRNLPAEIIDNVQIFDRRSDQSQMSGFDDGNREKTINIVTKPDRRTGQFGKTSAGYGTDDRYMVGAAVNFFNDETRFTVTGLTNNINMLDFSVGETPGGGMRGRRGGWGGGTPNGIISTNTLGLNYSDMWGKKIEASGNYSFTNRKYDQTQTIIQNFVRPEGQVYNENNYSTNIENTHRFNMRLDYNIDDNNRLLITPNFSIQKRDDFSYMFGRTFDAEGPINESETTNDSENASYNFNNNLFYSHKFSKERRVFSTRLTTSYNANNGDRYRVARNIFYTEQDSVQELNQYTNTDGQGYSWEANFSYAEPIGTYSQLQLEYEIGNRFDDSDRRTYNYLEQTQAYNSLDTLLSNTFKSDYLTQEVELGYQYNNGNIRFQTELEYQQATLDNDQEFPREYNLSRTFNSILPSAQLEYKFSETRSLFFDYRADTDAPSVGQLQDVIDYSNPLRVSTGNPNLQQSYENRLRMRYRNFDRETNKVFFAFLMGSFVQNYISNSTFIVEDSLRLSDEIVLGDGARFTQPVNLDGYWNIRSFFNFGRPVNFISSNFSVNGGFGYSRIPGLINNEETTSNEVNYANNLDFGLGISLSSNISEKIDFNFSTRSRYNVVQNTLLTQQNNNYFNQNTNLRYNWIFWKGLVYRTELNHQFNSGLSEGVDNNFLIWNMSISKKIFKNQKGEVSLSVNDLLNQNTSVQRNVQSSYIEDVQTNILQRYFMLTFTYNIRNFGGKLPEDLQPQERGSFPGGPPRRN
ncbi:outer membrane beta-barrel protein [Pontibacter silvestris]|uniref:Outer membrane beta-barrel protein n=1 Tax=Pontibacter silvestris TaxID=2305183 RepID=A0ABW4WYJ8_9BACT|nr:TonB-dependent receptor [Pontibacter silvestris]MCC9137436.1 TonB dependent receptor [Pontibacter silvestris]